MAFRAPGLPVVLLETVVMLEPGELQVRVAKEVAMMISLSPTCPGPTMVPTGSSGQMVQLVLQAAQALKGLDGQRGIAIYNEGTVKTGGGNDTIDALEGGFGGGGKYFLGWGRDTVKGFGDGYFDGGWGRDTLMLPGQEEDYNITWGRRTDIFEQDGMTLTAKSFETVEFLG